MLTVLVVLAVLLGSAVVHGAVLVVVARARFPESERLPLRRWTRWDLWYHLRAGAHDLTRVRSVALRR